MEDLSKDLRIRWGEVHVTKDQDGSSSVRRSSQKSCSKELFRQGRGRGRLSRPSGETEVVNKESRFIREWNGNSLPSFRIDKGVPEELPVSLRGGKESLSRPSLGESGNASTSMDASLSVRAPFRRSLAGRGRHERARQNMPPPVLPCGL